MRLLGNFCFLVLITAAAVLAGEGDLSSELLTSEAALAKMLEMATPAQLAYPCGDRLTVKLVVFRADEQKDEYRAPLVTDIQKKRLPGESATERTTRVQALIDEMQRQKVQGPLVARTRHILFPAGPPATASYRVVLSQQVVADLNRLGIENLHDHFAGKVVTVKGTVTWVRWTIDIAPRDFELHVDTLADIVDVKAAVRD
jgi:hypothetical protein